jgi:hypothetical protein
MTIVGARHATTHNRIAIKTIGADGSKTTRRIVGVYQRDESDKQQYRIHFIGRINVYADSKLNIDNENVVYISVM